MVYGIFNYHVNKFSIFFNKIQFKKYKTIFKLKIIFSLVFKNRLKYKSLRYSHISFTIVELPVSSPILNNTLSNLASLNASKTTIVRYMLRTQLRSEFRLFWRLATIIHTVLQVFVPVILVAGNSILMAITLFNVSSWQSFLDCSKFAVKWKYIIMSKKSCEICKKKENLKKIFIPKVMLLRNANFTPANQKRASIIVLTIATSFAVFQLPSAIVYIWELCLPQNDATATNTKLFVTIATLANFLVVTSKMANFFLFCMSR